MKILQLIDNLNSGGSERMCVNIANVLHEHGYEVQICASREGGVLKKLIAPGIKCHILNKKNTFDLYAFKQFIKIIRAERIDIIHGHSSSLFWAILAKVFAGNLKIIWHDHLGFRTNDHWMNFFYILISPKIDAIIAVNQDLVNWSRENMKVPQEKIFFINNFPLLRQVPKSGETNFFTIVCLANLRPPKDHETLLRAIGIVKRQALPKPLRVILAGAYQEDEYFFRLKILMNQLDLNSIVELTGSVEDIAILLAKADCGVLSSISEGLPVSLLEYGLAGLPVIVTNVGQCAEVVKQGKYGKIISPSDPDCLAKELWWIIQNPDLASNLGNKFKDHVNNEYGPLRFLSRYKSLLKQVCPND